MGAPHRTIIRRVEGEGGDVEMELLLRPRFDYGQHQPWQRCERGKAIVVVGPDHLTLHANVALKLEGDAVIARFRLSRGQSANFTLQYSLSFEREPLPVEPDVD